MPVPKQFRLQSTPKKLVAQMCDLCSEIEDADDESRGPLLARWHQHARRRCEPFEFETYWKSTDKETFVREALNPPPTFVDDVAYADVAAILEYVTSAEGAEHETTFYLRWLEAQFPDSNISDLIYWPDEWFGDASLVRNPDGSFKPESELTTAQTLAYAMARSGRTLPDAPSNVFLPFPTPPT